MKRVLILFLMIQFCVIGPGSINTLNARYLKAPLCNENAGLNRIVDSLIRNVKSDYEKTRVIYQWIRENITYDLDMYDKYLANSSDFRSKSLDSILLLRTGICFDFANLTKSMLARAKIQCEIVEGYGRYDDEDFFKKPRDLNHAWNAVFIENKWLFLDATWASILYNENNPVNYFFLMSPDEFLFTHFPEDKKWLLTNKTISFSEFLERPIVKIDFFRHIKSFPDNQGIISTKKDFIVIEDIYRDANTELLFELEDAKNGEIYVLVPTRYKEGVKPYIKFNIPAAGSFYFKVISEEKGEGGANTLLTLITYFVTKE